MVAFDGAVALGVDMLEMDVRLTADSVLVTHHDDTLRRTSDGEGLIIGYTLEELGRFNFGAKFAGLEKKYPYRNCRVRITTLESVLLKYGSVRRMFLEIKGEGGEGLRCAEKIGGTSSPHGDGGPRAGFGFQRPDRPAFPESFAGPRADGHGAAACPGGWSC